MSNVVPNPPAPPPKRVIREGYPWEGKRQADLPPAPYVPSAEPSRRYTHAGIQQMTRISYWASGALVGFLIGVFAGAAGCGQ